MRGYLSEAFVSFQGEGLHIGRPHLFLRFAGCPLRCRYCDTPDSLVRTDQFVVRQLRAEHRRPNPVDVDSVTWAVNLLMGDAGSVDAVALTGGEPLAQTDFLATILASGVLPRPRLLETAGTMPRQLERVIADIDIVSMDVKLPSNTGETMFWNEHRRFLQIAAGKVYVKMLIDEATALEDVERGARLVEETSPAIPIFLQPITAADGRIAAGPEKIAASYAAARAIVADVRVVPQAHKMMEIR